jgi:hypothetical protein
MVSFDKVETRIETDVPLLEQDAQLIPTNLYTGRRYTMPAVH